MDRESAQAMSLPRVHARRWLSLLLLMTTVACRSKVESGEEDVEDTSAPPTSNVDFDGDGFTETEDCDDEDASVHPDAEEICDGIDNDCDGAVDEGLESLWYADEDGDGFGDAATSVIVCEPPSGYVTDGTDCDDADATENPDADEVCDGDDDDCDGEIDEDPVDGGEYATDDDGDGWGDRGSTGNRCDGVFNELDCDDTDASEPQVVDASGVDTATGSADSPWSTIQQGIDNAEQCVVVHAGSYNEVIDFGGSNIWVTSVDGADKTIIHGTGLDGPVVAFHHSETSSAELSGFTITDGGGYVENTTTTEDCTSIYVCTSYYETYCGGGIYVQGADPTLTDLLVFDNSLPTVSTSGDDVDTYYVSSFGGGACFLDSSSTLKRVDFQGNYADQGGGLYVDESSAITMDEGHLMGNWSTDGGGLEVSGGSVSLTNVVSSYNEALDEGGGVLIVDGNLSSTNVTHGLDAATIGGGVHVGGTGSAIVINTIVYGVTSGGGIHVDDGVFWSGSYNNVYGNSGGEYSGISDPTGSAGNISADPLFTSVTDDGLPTNDIWTLSTGSPSIDAGDPSAGYQDADGSTNDQGAYGGPSGGW